MTKPAHTNPIHSPMSFTRFEAFTDGVFAIVITLLVIEIKVPDIAGATLTETIHRLLQLWPHLLSYVTSFAVIGVLWLNHNALFHFVRRVDRGTLLLNLLLLMCLAFIPFTTELIGTNAQSQPAVMIYGLWLCVTGLVYNALWGYMAWKHIVPLQLASRSAVRAASFWSIGYPLAYLVASLLSFASLRLSVLLYAAIPVFYLLPSRIDKLLTKGHSA
jgi:uncharacterized membrane protein